MEINHQNHEKQKPLIRIGWANSWRTEEIDVIPHEILSCRIKSHPLKSVILNPCFSGHDRLFWCDECGWRASVGPEDHIT